MILKHFFEPQLAQSSFLVGCPATGLAIVIDPVRRVDQYIEAADAEGLQIAGVTETHIHADFVSGALALARKAGATLYLSGEGGPEWQYQLPRDAPARTIGHGDAIHIGRVRLDVVHTPGHTPEHVSFLVVDEAAARLPLGAFTGDFLFAGDVGRPDLLERALGQHDTAIAAARRLFQSLAAFGAHPDWLMVWPGHGAGSACGKQLGGVPVTTIGYEKLTNWAFATTDEDAFVRTVLSGQPDPPRYFREMKGINRAGGARAASRPEPRRIAVSDLEALVVQHAEFVDLRDDAVSTGYLPGSIAIPLTRQFLTHAGSVMRYGMPVYLVAHDINQVNEASEALALIGIDDVRGWIPEGGLSTYERSGGSLERLVDVDVEQALERQQDGHLLLDVRTTAEWQAGHIGNAVHAPLALLLDRVRELDRDTPLVVYCQAGARSTVAATALRRVGFTRVANFAEGYAGFVRQTAAIRQ